MTTALAFLCAMQSWQPKTTFVDPNKLAKPYSKRSVIKIPKVTWPRKDDYLIVPSGFQVKPFCKNLQSPRWMLVLPNGDVLVTECYQNRVVLLRDADHDGVAEYKSVFAKGLNWPFGLALQDGHVYIANTDSVVRGPYLNGADKIGLVETVIAKIPSKGFHQHWTRNILFEPDGTHFYLTLGSETNRGPEAPGRALVWRCSKNGKVMEPWATGLRNPVGLTYRPGTRDLWCTVVERDYMGDDVVPDFLTQIHKGDNYGWPSYYTGQNRDPKAPRPARSSKTPRVPDVLFTAHSVPLGLTFCDSPKFPASYQGDLFVAMRGSTNRSLMTGYEVVRVRFKDGKPNPTYEEFVTGWCPNRKSQTVYGRPVGLAWWTDGSLLIADEGGNRIWRVLHD